MKSRVPLYGLSLAALLLTGCASDNKNIETATPSAEQQTAADRWMVNSIEDSAINNGIVTQHTLFPYHFEADHDCLNELGLRDLTTLANHFRGISGQINVRRGNVPETLYRARLDSISKRLAQMGLDSSRITLADALPAGQGLTSEQVIHILQRDRKAQPLSASQQDNSSTLATPVTETTK